MNRSRTTTFAAVVFVAATLAACDNNTKPSLVSDAEINADIAATAGDALALSVANMAANESYSSLSGSPPPSGSNLSDGSITYSRTRTCYDGSGTVLASCQPLSAVRTIVTHVQLDGNRSGTRDDNVTFSGAVHRTSDDSLTRVFVSTTETQRVHNDRAVAHDTATFTGSDRSRFVSEAARDSVKGVTFNVPRSSNPFPVAGSIVRLDTVHVIVTKGTETADRTVVRRVEVTFPADNQGNVVLKVNATTCNLNLVTGKVSGCA